MFPPVLALHIAAGSVALASMWIPLVSRKGSRLHRRSGWVFVAAMAVVSATALVLAGARFLLDPRPAAQQTAVFLLYVAVLTAASVSAGVRVLRVKQRATAHRNLWDLGLPGLLTVTAAGVAAYGVMLHQPLFVAFAALGIVNGVRDLRYWLRPPSSRMHWWFAHMGGMLGGCIAALTAFLVANAGHLGLWQLAAWLSPSIIGAPAIAVWITYYKRVFATAAAVSSGRLRVSGYRADTSYHAVAGASTAYTTRDGIESRRAPS